MSTRASETIVRFIDLFAGLGGFHLALRELGHECVFASEIDPQLQTLYQANFNMVCAGDIAGVDAREVPAHDILCAGFPCQPFSKAGFQYGFQHATLGTLFHDILRIASQHKPNWLILENVANFQRHDDGNTWRVVRGSLEELGYSADICKLSPHEFGVPQIRDRVFIVAYRGPLHDFVWPTTQPLSYTINDFLDREPTVARTIPTKLTRAISAWQEFLDRYPKCDELPSFPIWSMEFGATYPDSGVQPRRTPLRDIRRQHGSHGVSLRNTRTWDDVWFRLPSYAKEPNFPRWKQRFIQQNRELYARNSGWIDTWLPRIQGLPASLQKLEWNCHGDVRDLRRYILQARPSGIRVKRANWSPALVALTTTQVPIIGWANRYLTLRECMRLQSMDKLPQLPSESTAAYRALGNAVNVEVVRRVALAISQRFTPIQSLTDEAGTTETAAALVTGGVT